MCKTCYVFPVQHSSSLQAFSKLSNKLFYTSLKKQGKSHKFPAGLLPPGVPRPLEGERWQPSHFNLHFYTFPPGSGAVGTAWHSDCCFPCAIRAHFRLEVLDKVIIPNFSQNNRNIGIWQYLKDSWDRIIRKIKPFLSCRYKWAFSLKKETSNTEIIYQPDG